MQSSRLIDEHAAATARRVLGAIRLPPSLADALAFSIVYRLLRDGIRAYAKAAGLAEDAPGAAEGGGRA